MYKTDALAYEYFIRNVFMCERGEDPAHLADADINNLAWNDNNYFKEELYYGSQSLDLRRIT